MTCNSKHFTTAPEAKLIWRSSLPMLSAILFLLAYDLLESSLIALQSSQILAAFGFTLPITTAMSALAIGLSIRANNKVVHANCKKPLTLTKVTSQSISSSFIIVTGISALFFIFEKQLLLLTGNGNLISEIAMVNSSSGQSQYLELRFLGWVFLAMVWQVSAILRALGWMKLASQLILGWASTKSLLAILLLMPQSPFFISSLEGVAIVHVAADFIFAMTSLAILHQKVGLTFDVQLFKRSKKSEHKHSILIVIQQFITPISMAVLTSIAAQIDTSYVAALALLFRLEMLFLLLPMVLTTSMPAIVGANYWLGHKPRVNNLYRSAFISIALFQLLIAGLVFSQGHLLTHFICPHDIIAEHLNNYLTWVPWSYGAAGITIVFQSCLNAKNLTLQATVLGISHRLLFLLPLTLTGAYLFGDSGFYQGLMLGHFASLIITIYFFKRFKLHKKVRQSSNEFFKKEINPL